MTRIDIISGFLGAGKTTLIKKLIEEAYPGEKLVLIENEFGEINIDGGFLKDAGIEITEMQAGCICCTLVGDFHAAILQVQDQFTPDRILIEPSGVGRLSDVILAVKNAIKDRDDMELDSFVTVVDGSLAELYLANFGEFYENQVETAGTLILSRTQTMTEAQIMKLTDTLRTINPDAPIITTPWSELSGSVIRNAMEQVTLEEELLEKIRAEHEAHEAEHHHHHHEEHEHCHHDHEEHEHCHHDHEKHEHPHDHDHEEHEHCHHEHDEHCHHDHDEHEHHHDHEEHEHCHDEHEHRHDHEHDGIDHSHCDHEHGYCCHDHEHHHHHDADEVFDSWGKETPQQYSEEELQTILSALGDREMGFVLRAKGIVSAGDSWLEFDYTPAVAEIRPSSADYTSRFCVIGTGLDTAKLAELFRVQ